MAAEIIAIEFNFEELVIKQFLRDSKFVVTPCWNQIRVFDMDHQMNFVLVVSAPIDRGIISRNLIITRESFT